MDHTGLFPDPVALVRAEDRMWQTPLRVEEEALIAGAIEKRQREFRAGRHAAHAALSRLGAPDKAILRGERREPLWPDGYLGTIAHCRDLCLAACAVEGEIAGLGMDVEPLIPLPTGVGRYVHDEEEAAFMQRRGETLPGRLIFSAKESLYKCYYPLLKRYFGFHSVSLTIDEAGQRFGFRPTRDCKIDFPDDLAFHGRYRIDHLHLYTTGWLTRT